MYLNLFVLIDVCSVALLVACLRISTRFRGVSLRETHLWEDFGRADKIALITCLKNLNISSAFSETTRVGKPITINKKHIYNFSLDCPAIVLGLCRPFSWIFCEICYAIPSSPQEKENRHKQIWFPPTFPDNPTKLCMRIVLGGPPQLIGQNNN